MDTVDNGADEARDELLGVLREVLAKRDTTPPPLGDVPVLDRAWWRLLCELGVLAVPLEEDAGGLGLGLTASAMVFEALGAARAPGPWTWTQLAALVDGEAASGATVVAGVDLAGQAAGDPVLVPHGAQADAVLVLAADAVTWYDRSQVELVELDAPIDPETRVARVDSFGEGRQVGDAATATRLRRAGTLLTAGALVGTSQAALDVAVEYSRGRHQFGRPIGSFQALKHLMADAYTRTNQARAAVYAAAELEDAGAEGAGASSGFDVEAAKLLAASAANDNARTAIQVHGGMGFAWETPPHLLLKRTWLLEHEFGTMHDHALAIADALERSVR